MYCVSCKECVNDAIVRDGVEQQVRWGSGGRGAREPAKRKLHLANVLYIYIEATFFGDLSD